MFKEIYFYVWPWIQWFFVTGASCTNGVTITTLVVVWVTRGQTWLGC